MRLERRYSVSVEDRTADRTRERGHRIVTVTIQDLPDTKLLPSSVCQPNTLDAVSHGGSFRFMIA